MVNKPAKPEFRMDQSLDPREMIVLKRTLTSTSTFARHARRTSSLCCPSEKMCKGTPAQDIRQVYDLSLRTRKKWRKKWTSRCGGITQKPVWPLNGHHSCLAQHGPLLPQRSSCGFLLQYQCLHRSEEPCRNQNQRRFSSSVSHQGRCGKHDQTL